MISDQHQGKILAFLPWEGYLSLEEVSTHTRLPITICQENIYKLIIRQMVMVHLRNPTLYKKRSVK